MDKIYFYYLKPWLKPVRKLQTHFEDFQTHFSGGLDLGYLPVRQAGSQLENKNLCQILQNAPGINK